jgi:glycerol-3-phosphate acyltransferase PlsY
LVFFLDALKGALPAAVGLALDSRPMSYLLVAAAVLGHMFPVTRHFRGGKGVATMAGAIVVLHPLTSLVLTAVWFITRQATHKASLASLAITFGLPICPPSRGSGMEFVSVIAPVRWCWCVPSTTSSG